MKQNSPFSIVVLILISFSFSATITAQVPDTLNIEEILITAKRSDDIIKTNINGQLIET